jgi:predicted transcriptional regulator
VRTTASPCGRSIAWPNPLEPHRVGRDIKAVHSDVKSLQMAGVLDKSPEGRAIFPYDEVRVNFSWHGRPHTKCAG